MGTRIRFLYRKKTMIAVSLFAVLCLALGGLIIRENLSPLDRAGLGFGVAIILPSLYLLLRVARLGVGVYPRGIIIRNYLSSPRIPWGDIETFGPSGQTGVQEGLRVQLVSGRVLRCRGLTQTIIEDPSKVDTYGTALNRYLHLARENDGILDHGSLKG